MGSLSKKDEKELEKLKKEWAKNLAHSDLNSIFFVSSRKGFKQKREERKREILSRREEEWKKRIIEILRRSSTSLSPSQISSYTGIDEAFLADILLDLIYEDKIEKDGYSYKLRKKLKLDIGF